MNVSLQAWMPLNQIDDAANGNDCWGYVAPSGREYGIMCTSNGTNFIEITDPANPDLIAHIAGPVSLWRDCKTRFRNREYSVPGLGRGPQILKAAWG